MATNPPAGPGYETRDASIRGLAIFGAGLFGTLLLVFLAAVVAFRYFARSQSLGPPASPFADVRALPPQPRLQVEPRQDLQSLRQREDAILGSYGWVDPRAGIVRIPIDQAIDRLLEKGLPVDERKAEKRK
jgi:hypothetical protein